MLFSHPICYFHINSLGNVTKSWIPASVFTDFPSRYGYDSSILSRIETSDDYQTSLFSTGTDHIDEDVEANGDEGLQLNSSLWTYDDQLLLNITENFQPLTIDDTVDECVARYKAVIDYIDIYFDAL